MNLSLSRRNILQGIGMTALAGISGATLGSLPARAGVGWGPGPKSGLPFWLGAHGDYGATTGLLPAGRGVDLVNLWETENTYMADAAKNAPVPVRTPKGWASNIAHNLSGDRPGQRGAMEQLALLQRPDLRGAELLADQRQRRRCRRASQLLGAADLYRRRRPRPSSAAKQRRVWQIAADGWIDHVWRDKLLQYKKNYFVYHNLRNIRIVMRVAHELNTKHGWGNRTYRRGYGMMALTTVGDYQIVQEGLRRYMAVFLDVFGNTQASIPGDFAYADNQLWPYWNTGPSHKGPVDSRLTCPANAKLVGPDYYNFWPATLNDVEWNTNLYAQSKQGWPRGIGAWLNWAKSIGRPLCLGEWALMTKNTNPDGSRPASDGWDNPVFIKNMLDFLKANAADIGFVSYFNQDVAPSPDLPGHLIKTWPGIDEPSTNCVRFPVGDNNRCGARAFKQWASSNS